LRIWLQSPFHCLLFSHKFMICFLFCSIHSRNVSEHGLGLPLNIMSPVALAAKGASTLKKCTNAWLLGKPTVITVMLVSARRLRVFSLFQTDIQISLRKLGKWNMLSLRCKV
jgi:hypothetical protein